MDCTARNRSTARLGVAALGLAAAAFAAGGAGPCQAADGSEPSSGWSFRLRPMAMAVDMGGSARYAAGTTIGGNIILVDTDYSAIFPVPQPLYLLDVAARRGRWGLWIRGQYLSWDERVFRADWVQLAETSWFVEACATRSLGSHWTVSLGLRYFDLESVIDGPLFLPPERRSVSTRNESWLDPVVGVAFAQSLGRRWQLEARGDVGGFGAGSELTWSVEAVVEWRFAEHVGLAGGYRVFDVDFEDEYLHTLVGGNLVAVPNTYAMRTYGPSLGLTVRW